MPNLEVRPEEDAPVIYELMADDDWLVRSIELELDDDPDDDMPDTDNLKVFFSHDINVDDYATIRIGTSVEEMEYINK